MYFLTDAKNKQITAFEKMGYAARYVFHITNRPRTDNPVNDVMKLPEYGDRFLIMSTSDAFEAIENSDNEAAQELARDFKKAVDKFYE